MGAMMASARGRAALRWSLDDDHSRRPTTTTTRRHEATTVDGQADYSPPPERALKKMPLARVELATLALLPSSSS